MIDHYLKVKRFCGHKDKDSVVTVTSGPRWSGLRAPDFAESSVALEWWFLAVASPRWHHNAGL